MVETAKAIRDADAAAPGESPPGDGPGPARQPDAPLVVIAPERPWSGPDLRDLWAYRELLYFLVWRDIKVRYKQTVLGAAWAVLQPLLTMIVFTLIFGRLAGAADGLPYPLFAYTGLLLWTFFAHAVTNSSNSLVGNSNLITKVYFPRVVIPAAVVAAGLLDLLIASALLVPLAAWHGVGLAPTALLAPLFVLMTALLALGVGLWASALTVKYRDVRHALPFFVHLCMFVSSVVAPSGFVPEGVRPLLFLNPMVGIIDNFRAALFGGTPDWASLSFAAAATLAIFVCSVIYFRRVESVFADVV